MLSQKLGCSRFHRNPATKTIYQILDGMTWQLEVKSHNERFIISGLMNQTLELRRFTHQGHNKDEQGDWIPQHLKQASGTSQRSRGKPFWKSTGNGMYKIHNWVCPITQLRQWNGGLPTQLR
eukprot:Protomagalhaensia_wolfi_Nauph_80__3877@NODE_3928_length_678_cov_7_395931_g3109_i0_p1_GENE_NODE_3928_length_678_cov_7_395931_g3109_i0NODE_3928_length_678_cov_7_395931_g3109_i0_p1_ORF_typecomplete_len122_score5_96YkuD_2/PF13645_6/0_045_NODE_3928_length_678_cov_7_395931_g3109_i030395